MTCNVKLSKGKSKRFINDIYMEEHDALNRKDCEDAFRLLVKNYPNEKVEYVLNTN